MAQQQSQLLLGALEKLGGAGPGVTRDGCPRSLIFLIFHGSPLPFSFACFQNISSAFFGCPCFREAKILKEPVTESPEQFSTQRFTGVPSFWWVVKKTRGVGCFRRGAMTAFSRLPIKFRRCGKYLLFLSVP